MKKVWIFLILVALLLTACAPEKGPQETTQTPTVENVFPQPSTTAPDTPTETTAPVGLGGGLGFGFETQERDDQGSYLTYTGGELVAPLSIDGSGSIGSRGSGVLLFVDGLPQPSKAEGGLCLSAHLSIGPSRIPDDRLNLHPGDRRSRG